MDWEAVRRRLNNQPWLRVEDNQLERYIKIADIPSGKSYPPWLPKAASCTRCQRELDPCDEVSPCIPDHCEFCKDQTFLRDIEEEGKERGFFIFCEESAIMAGETKPMENAVILTLAAVEKLIDKARRKRATT